MKETKLYRFLVQDKYAALLGATITDNNIHLEASWRVDSRQQIAKIISCLRDDYPDHPVLTHRSDRSLTQEWLAHNRLYHWGIQQERTRSVDLDYPQPLLHRIAYALLSI